jgi:hypothetical protein
LNIDNDMESWSLVILGDWRVDLGSYLLISMPNWVVIWKKDGWAFQWMETEMARTQLQYSVPEKERQTEIAEMLE